MTDDMPRLGQGGSELATEAPARARLAEPALAYDYFKSMVSLSVATQGGILTLGETVFGARLLPLQIVFAARGNRRLFLRYQSETDVVLFKNVARLAVAYFRTGVAVRPGPASRCKATVRNQPSHSPED